MKKFIANLVLTAAALTWASASHAALMFTDVSYTTNSLTFTIDGDLSGYATPSYDNQFSIQYLGDIWNGATTFSINSWSSSVFDNLSFIDFGRTGVFYSSQPDTNPAYTWSKFSLGLGGAIVDNATITLTLGGNYLDELALNPVVSFLWGNGNVPNNPTLLATVDINNQGSTESQKSAAVPEPSVLALMGLGFAAFGFSRRKSTRRS